MTRHSIPDGKATARCLAGNHQTRSEEHTSELQSRLHLVCRLLLEKKKTSIPGTPTSKTKPNMAATPLPQRPWAYLPPQIPKRPESQGGPSDQRCTMTDAAATPSV